MGLDERKETPTEANKYSQEGRGAGRNENIQNLNSFLMLVNMFVPDSLFYFFILAKRRHSLWRLVLM